MAVTIIMQLVAHCSSGSVVDVCGLHSSLCKGTQGITALNNLITYRFVLGRIPAIKWKMILSLS